jgi:hypothetical protein
MFLGSKARRLHRARGGCIGLTTLPPSVSRLSRQCGIVNISEPYTPPRPVTGIEKKWYEVYELNALLFVEKKKFLVGSSAPDSWAFRVTGNFSHGTSSRLCRFRDNFAEVELHSFPIPDGDVPVERKERELLLCCSCCYCWAPVGSGYLY